MVSTKKSQFEESAGRIPFHQQVFYASQGEPKNALHLCCHRTGRTHHEAVRCCAHPWMLVHNRCCHQGLQKTKYPVPRDTTRIE